VGIPITQHAMGSGLAFCLTPAYREAMARPLRLEFPGALYHVTARGDRREEIVNDNDDRSCLLDISGEALVRFDAVCFAYCLMGNHYHFVVETRRANLSRLMRHVNGVYTQRCNRRHKRVGRLFQGGSRRSSSIGMRTSWRCAATSISTRCVQGSCAAVRKIGAGAAI
jgi:REP element-mobilizing transposase RayT